MLLDLEKNGLDSVRKYSKRFDGWDPPDFELSKRQIDIAISECDKQLIADTDYCQSNVRNFAVEQLKAIKDCEVETQPGIILGHKHIPVSNLGCYIPGGVYPMFGSAQMSIIPAKVAGVDNVVACTPPVKGAGYYPATINAIYKAGADRIFILGGVQAFAMMAFGMDVVPPVDMLCGAGNKFIVEAKRQLFGRCGIDLLAGPTEIAIIADNSADPVLVACDLLGQAEHDLNSGQLLVCFDERFAKNIINELKKQLKSLPTKDIASLSWKKNGKVYLADDREEAVKIVDDYAPEHLELQTEDNDYYFSKLKNYGSLFIGEETTVAYGDKCIGTNHILPTGRAARYTGGLWVGKFLKTVTYQKMTEEASIAIGEVTERQCNVEHMLAHSLTAEYRVKKYSGI
jgi:sulfopropanediol 3-dehydrogenase